MRQKLTHDIDPQEVFHALAEASPDCIKILTPEGKLLYINKSGLAEHDLLSVELAQKRGWNALNTMVPESRSAFLAALTGATQGKTTEVDVRHTDEGSDRVACSEVISPIHDDSGKIIAILVVGRDMTMHKNTTDELRASHALLEAQIAKKTSELQKKIKELERWRRATVGREIEMVKLKREIKRLKYEAVLAQLPHDDNKTHKPTEEQDS